MSVLAFSAKYPSRAWSDAPPGVGPGETRIAQASLELFADNASTDFYFHPVTP